MTSDLDISALTDAQLVDRLTTIVSRAAAAILTFDPATAPRRTKNDRSPVSAADEAANAIIVEELSRLLPNMPIVSEETHVRQRNPAALAACFALVDPLDGTREFLAGRDEFTVNVALVIRRNSDRWSHCCPGARAGVARRRSDEARSGFAFLLVPT